MIYTSVDPKLKIKKVEDFLDFPVVVRVNKFDEASALAFSNDFTKATNTGQPVIPIVIDSYGGQVYSLMSMMGLIKSSCVPVATIVQGKAMSCGALLFSCGSEGLRYMDSLSTLMIHDVSAGAVGKVEEMKVDVKEAERLNQLVYKMMAKNVGKHETYFTDIVHSKGHADWFLDAEEAKSHNLCNKIGMPSFNVSVKVEMNFV
jgi:ATP-dependent Clp protease protease subunit